jgi:hypothetical protein
MVKTMVRQLLWLEVIKRAVEHQQSGTMAER